jgi:hypothetical protein
MFVVTPPSEPGPVDPFYNRAARACSGSGSRPPVNKKVRFACRQASSPSPAVST